MWMTSQPLRARPIGLPLRGSPVLSGESETFVVRSWFVPVDLRANWCSACPAPAPHPRRNQVGPGNRVEGADGSRAGLFKGWPARLAEGFLSLIQRIGWAGALLYSRMQEGLA